MKGDSRIPSLTFESVNWERRVILYEKYAPGMAPDSYLSSFLNMNLEYEWKGYIFCRRHMSILLLLSRTRPPRLCDMCANLANLCDAGAAAVEEDGGGDGKQ